MVGASEVLMQPISKKLKIIALVVSASFGATFLLDAMIINSFGNRSSPISSDSLALLKALLMFMSAYGLAAAWFFQFRRTTILDRLSLRRRWLSPEVSFLLINYLLLLSPVLFGLLLYFCGMSLREYFYFVGVSIAMTLAWGSYDLRKT